MESKCPVCQKGTVGFSYDGLKVECSKCWFRCHVEHLPRIAAAMDAERRLTELQEAVRWERECENFTHYARHAAYWLPYTWRGVSEIFESCKAARAAVDALVGEG